MADESFINKKDLAEVTQKVTIENSKDIAKPLVDQQKNNDLKELERTIEQTALFQDIANGINNLGDSLLDGFKSLIPKTDGGLSKLLGLGFGLLLAPFVAFISFISQLGIELNFFTKGKAGEWLKNLKLRFANFFGGIFDKLKNSKLGAFITGIIDKLKNSKLFKSISSLFEKVFGGKGGFFKGLGDIFGKIVKFATGGPFKMIINFAKNIGRILGKVFLPISILMSIFDFVGGFMRGYKEGGIIEGIKQGIMDLFDGLVGSLLRMLMWIPSKIAELLGLNKFSKAISEQTETFIQSIKDVFGGLVDLVVAIFTWDTQKMKASFSKIWEGIVNIVKGPFTTLKALIEDVFDIDMDEMLEPLYDILDVIGDFFADILQFAKDKLGLSWIKDQWEKLTDDDDDDDKKTSSIKSSSGRMPSGRMTPYPVDAFGIPRGASNSNSNTIINNNNNYNINAPSDIGVRAMQRSLLTRGA